MIGECKNAKKQCIAQHAIVTAVKIINFKLISLNLKKKKCC